MGIMHEIILRWIQRICLEFWQMEQSFIRSVVPESVVPHAVELPEKLGVVGRFLKPEHE